MGIAAGRLHVVVAHVPRVGVDPGKIGPLPNTTVWSAANATPVCKLQATPAQRIDQFLLRLQPAGCLRNVNQAVQENRPVRIVIPLRPVAKVGQVIPDAIQPRAGLLRLRCIGEQLDAQRHAAAVAERMIVRMLRPAFEIEERGTQALVDDLFHPRLLRLSQHVLPDQLLVNAHPARPTPSAVVAAAVMIALERAPIRRLPRNLVAAVGGEENIKQVALAALLAACMPVEDQRAEHRPQDADGILILSAAVHVACPKSIPLPPTTGKRVPLRLAQRPAQCRLHLFNVLNVSVIVTRMPGEKGLFCKRLGQGQAKGTKQQPNGNSFHDRLVLSSLAQCLPQRQPFRLAAWLQRLRLRLEFIRPLGQVIPWKRFVIILYRTFASAWRRSWWGRTWSSNGC